MWYLVLASQVEIAIQGKSKEEYVSYVPKLSIQHKSMWQKCRILQNPTLSLMENLTLIKQTLTNIRGIHHEQKEYEQGENDYEKHKQK